jgi:kynurenine formamidase
MDADVTDGMDLETYLLWTAISNLDQVPAAGRLIVATWPKVKDDRGFPARALRSCLRSKNICGLSHIG